MLFNLFHLPGKKDSLALRPDSASLERRLVLQTDLRLWRIQDDDVEKSASGFIR